MPPTLIALLVQAGLQYGPQFVTDIIAILKNPNATVADVKAAFSNLKPYEAYNIPNVGPLPINAIPTSSAPVVPPSSSATPIVVK